MTDSLFNNEDTFDQNKNYLEELVGEGKKFKSPEELAKGKAESDAYIKTLLARQDEMRRDLLATKEDANARANLQSLIDQLSNPQPKTNISDITQSAQKSNEQPIYDDKAIEEKMRSLISANENSKKESDNYRAVMSKLQEKYGNSYGTHLKQQSEQLGLDETFVNEMARKHPTVFIKTFGLDQPAPESFQTPPRNTRRSDNFAPQGSEKRTWSYYQNLKKTQPNLYLDPKITVQMHKDAEALGEAFRDGDYYAV